MQHVPGTSQIPGTLPLPCLALPPSIPCTPILVGSASHEFFPHLYLGCGNRLRQHLLRPGIETLALRLGQHGRAGVQHWIYA